MRLRTAPTRVIRRAMEMQKRKADTAPDTDHHDRAVRSIVREFVLSLGRDRAMLYGGVCVITPAASSGRGQPGRSGMRPSRACLDAESGGCLGAVLSHRNGVAGGHAGRPLNSASVWPQMARPHFAQRGM